MELVLSYLHMDSGNQTLVARLAPLLAWPFSLPTPLSVLETRSHYVDQSSLNLQSVILLSQLPECWNYRCDPLPHLAFEFCLSKAPPLVLSHVPSSYSCELSLFPCYSKEEIPDTFFFILAGLFDPYLLDDYPCLEFSEKIKMTQGRNAKNSGL